MDSTKALDPKAYQAATNAAADAINDLNLEPSEDLPLDPPLKAAITAYLAALSAQGEAAQPAADGCLWIDKPCTCGGGPCEQVDFSAYPAASQEGGAE